MVKRDATTVEEYLASLPDDRRTLLERVRELVRRHIPAGYEETLVYGMISWVVPLSRYPDTYNGQPLAIISLGAQKRHTALYLQGPYVDPELDGKLRQAYKAADKKLDMGKSCLRFQRWEQLEPEVLSEIVASIPPDRFIEINERIRSAPRPTRPGRR